MPRVTVGLAVYNGAATLRESLESVFAQTYRDFEVLVVDDGSTDGSGDMAASMGCRVLRQSNAGLGEGRRRLVAEASGELVAFIDADDVWVPEKLAAQVAVLEATGAALVHSDCWYVYEDGRSVARDLSLSPYADAFDHILPSNLVIASSALFSRSAMLEVGNFVADTVRCSDWYGWLLLASRFRFVHMQEKQVRYKVLSSSLANAGLRFHEAQRYLLEEKIVPLMPTLFARLEPSERALYERLVLRSLGVAYSSMAKYLRQEGKKGEAREMDRKALRYAPGVFRVWTRAARGLLP